MASEYYIKDLDLSIYLLINNLEVANKNVIENTFNQSTLDHIMPLIFFDGFVWFQETQKDTSGMKVDKNSREKDLAQ